LNGKENFMVVKTRACAWNFGLLILTPLSYGIGVMGRLESFQGFIEIPIPYR
jgi:hypothetical protein